jgi:hypothetical protein
VSVRLLIHQGARVESAGTVYVGQRYSVTLVDPVLNLETLVPEYRASATTTDAGTADVESRAPNGTTLDVRRGLALQLSVEGLRSKVVLAMSEQAIAKAPAALAPLRVAAGGTVTVAVRGSDGRIYPGVFRVEEQRSAGW